MADGKSSREWPEKIIAGDLTAERVYPQQDMVNHPLHYGGDTVYECIKVIHAWGLGFDLGSALKYIARAGKKDPDKEIEDLKKAIFYINHHIVDLEMEKGN